MKQPKRKSLLVLICLVPLLCGAAGNQTTKPKLRVAADGLPSGHGTPEGAACDVARSLINRDEKLFSSTCVRLYAGGNGPAAYAQFLRDTVQNIRQEAAKKEPSPGGPKSVGKVFAARHLSKNGPASYGYSAFGFQDIMFVDVGVFLYNGERSLMRTLVIKDRDGKWYVHPDPSASPLLSDGLNEEKVSVLDFTDAYAFEVPVRHPPDLSGTDTPSRLSVLIRLLSIPHLATRSEIEVFLSYYRERLEAVAVSFTSDVFRESSPVLYIQEDFCKDRTDIECVHFATNPHGLNVMPTWNGIVEFGQLANGKQKDAAWEFNIDCLKKVSGCRDISELNPAVWKRTSPHAVSSRMRSTADSIAEGLQPLPD